MPDSLRDRHCIRINPNKTPSSTPDPGSNPDSGSNPAPCNKPAEKPGASATHGASPRPGASTQPSTSTHSGVFASGRFLYIAHFADDFDGSAGRHDSLHDGRIGAEPLIACGNRADFAGES